MKARIYQTVVAAVAILVLIHSELLAQTVDHLSIRIEGRESGPQGGERRSVAAETGPIEVGKVTTHALSIRQMQCWQAGGGVGEEGYGGWTTEVTPVRIQNDAVTFRLRWVRARDNYKVSNGPAGDVELTLKPGEVYPIDSVVVDQPAGTSVACAARPVKTLVATVDFWPREEQDSRLAETELWLVHRFPGGGEQSELVTVRHTFGRETTFYFTRISDGGMSLDFYGALTVVPNAGGFRVALSVRSRTSEPGQAAYTLSLGQNWRSAREVSPSLRVGPNDVASVELPRLAENSSGAFANHHFSIRLRTKQIR